MSSFRVDKTHTHLFTNPNISLFPDEIFIDDKFSSLTQSTALLMNLLQLWNLLIHPLSFLFHQLFLLYLVVLLV